MARGLILKKSGSARQLHRRQAPLKSLENIAHKPHIATRQASADVLAELAKKVGSMILVSADLAAPDKTDAFLKNTHAFTSGDFSGTFLHAGGNRASPWLP